MSINTEPHDGVIRLVVVVVDMRGRGGGGCELTTNNDPTHLKNKFGLSCDIHKKCESHLMTDSAH